MNPSPKPPEPPHKPKLRLAFTVWQFVRIMVQLEKVGQKSAAYRSWWKDWSKLDRRLERLAQSDQARYSALMMDEEVVLEDATVEEARDVVRALDVVIRDMNAALQKGVEDDALTASIAEERDELMRLRDDIRKMVPTGGRGRTRRGGGPARKRPAKRPARGD